jgi:hypothetical protein
VSTAAARKSSGAALFSSFGGLQAIQFFVGWNSGNDEQFSRAKPAFGKLEIGSSRRER